MGEAGLLIKARNLQSLRCLLHSMIYPIPPQVEGPGFVVGFLHLVRVWGFGRA